MARPVVRQLLSEADGLSSYREARGGRGMVTSVCHPTPFPNGRPYLEKVYITNETTPHEQGLAKRGVSWKYLITEALRIRKKQLKAKAWEKTALEKPMLHPMTRAVQSCH